MVRKLIVMIKALTIAATHPPRQDFVNELYQREQAQILKYRYGIGQGAKGLPPGKYFR